MLVRCRPDEDGQGILEVVFAGRGGGEQVARNVSPFNVEPGKFTYRLVRGELSLQGLRHHRGPLPAAARRRRHAVPLTLLPSGLIRPPVRFAAACRPIRSPPTPPARSTGQVLERLGPPPRPGGAVRHPAPRRRPGGRRRRRAPAARAERADRLRGRVGRGQPALEIEQAPAVSLWAGMAGRSPGAAVGRGRRGDDDDVGTGPGGRPTRTSRDGPRASLGWPDDLPFEPQALLLLADPFTFAVDAPARRPGRGAPRPAGARRHGVGGRSGRAATAWPSTAVFTDGAVGALIGPGVTAVDASSPRAAGPSAGPSSSPGPSATSSTSWPASRRCERLLEMAKDGMSERDIAADQPGPAPGPGHRRAPGRLRPGRLPRPQRLGADQANGAIAVGDEVEVGTTVQFHVRDAEAADEDLRELLAVRQADGALLFTCNGRGIAAVRRARTTTPGSSATCSAIRPLAGFFAAGELGPVGGRNFVHGFTASHGPVRDVHRTAEDRSRIRRTEAPGGSPTQRCPYRLRPGLGRVARMSDRDLEQLGINVIRGLAMDAPQKANSGHPGTAMALAPLAHVLWTRIMRYDPSDPRLARPGPLRPLLRPRLDPAVLDAVPDRLRPDPRRPQAVPPAAQPDARPPRGPPRSRASRSPPARSARASPTASAWASPSATCGPASAPTLVDHHTFVICSDGDLMEGISHEAASLAGHLGLGRLVYVYDDNHITIDGPDRDRPSTDDAGKRFEAYGWHVDRLGEVANDIDALEAALRRAMAVEDRPSLLILRSHIGWPSPAQDRHQRGPRRAARRRRGPGDQGDPRPAARRDLLGARRGARLLPPSASRRGQALRRGVGEAGWPPGPATGTLWDACWRQPGRRRLGGQAADLAGRREAGHPRRPSTPASTPSLDLVPGLVAGGADLTGNTGTKLDDMPSQSAEHPEGRQIAFGVREHGMGGIMNGMALHGGALPVGGTFFIFSDYMRGVGPPGRPERGQGHLLLDPRLGRPRRGRPDPPADRAAGVAAGHARAAGHPPGRRQRDRPRLAHRRRQRRADRA